MGQRIFREIKRKVFLAPNSMNSMAAIFTKLRKDGTAIVRISDCNKTIRLWNNVNTLEGVAEMNEKLDTLIDSLTSYKAELNKIVYEEK